jgi:hypothetical protein
VERHQIHQLGVAAGDCPIREPVVDLSNAGRDIQIRGLAELVEDRAIENLDALTRKYASHPRYYGFVYPKGSGLGTRVICRIYATRVTLDAIHA